MGLNSLITYKGDLFDQKVKESLKTFYDRDRAISIEQQNYLTDLVESAVIDIQNFFETQAVSIRDRAISEELTETISSMYLYAYLISKLLDDMYNEHQKIAGFENSKLNDLTKITSSIKQKLSSLGLISGDTKYVYVESFNTQESISVKSNTLRAVAGTLTLPVENTNDIAIRSYSIGSGSVGSLGSSDPSNEANPDLTSFLSGDILQWEELEGSSAKLVLEIDLSKEEIVNQLLIRFAPIEQVSAAMIESIRCFSKGKKIELLNEPVEINPADVAIPFYPIKTSKIFVTITQTNGYEFIVSNNETIYRKVIAIDELKLQLTKYSQEAAIESKKIPIPVNPNSCEASIDIATTNDNLFSIDLLYSLDEGLSWLSSATIGAALSVDSLYWKVLVSRNDGAFIQNSSAHEAEIEYEYAYQLEFTSGLKSPSSFALKKKAINENVTVIQPRVLRKGGRYRELKIGEGSGVSTRIKLPVEVRSRLAKDAYLRVNGKRWSYVNTLTGQAATAEVWTLDKDNYRYVVFGDDVTGASPPDKSIITFSLDLEETQFEQVNDGYLGKFDYLFDPDKDNIHIIYVSESEASSKVILERGEDTHYLPYGNIVADSIVITEKTSSGSAYGSPIASTEVSFNSGDFTLASGQYTVDYQNGIIYLFEEIPNDDVMSVAFRYYPTKTIDNSKFKVVIEDSVPTGILVDRDSFPAKTITDNIGSNLQRLTPSGLVSYAPFNVGNIGDNHFVMSRRHPIRNTVNASELFSNTETTPPEEVEYIDGHTEFLGLIKVQSEKTSTIAGPNVVSFVVRGGANYYGALGIYFDDDTVFATEVSGVPASQGQWSVNTTTGTVSVHVGSGSLVAGINYTYYYRDNSFETTNKFSVNYKRGVLHSISTFKSGGSLTYKTGNFFVGYDIATLVEDFSFDKNSSILEIKTENNFDHSNLIKIIYPIKVVDTNIEDLKDYYSPIIKAFTFRFN